MPTYLNRREVLAGLLISMPTAAALAAQLSADEPSAAGKPAAEQPAKPRAAITISKETTYITEPLRPDGYPDYVAALNQRCSRGVTPENNAVVLILNVCGLPHNYSEHVFEADRRKYFQMLGIAPLSEKGDCYIDLQEYAKHSPVWRRLLDTPFEDNKSLFNQESATLKRPWSRQEFPFIVAWLAANEKPLSILIEASKRPRFFDPIVPGHDMNQVYMLSPDHFCPSMLYWGWLAYPDYIRALLTRAMAKLYDGKTDEAWEDILACHRLARLVGQGPMSGSAIVADGIDGKVLYSDRVLLGNARLTADQLAGMRKDLDELPPMPRMADKFDIGERFPCLDWALKCQRKGLATLKKCLTRAAGFHSDKKCHEAAKATLDLISSNAGIDWDIVLRTVNSCFDQIVDAQCKPTRSERAKTWRNVEDVILARAGSPYDPRSNLKEVYSKRIGLAFFFTEYLPESGTIADDRTAMTLDVTKLAFALAGYCADHGVYPEKLADLTPQYITAFPKDVFDNDADLHYVRQDSGYLLYSVGPNGRDDGGKGTDDLKKGDEGWDDIVVQMPAANK